MNENNTLDVRLRRLTPNLIFLQGGMKTKDRRAATERLAAIPQTEERLLLATGPTRRREAVLLIIRGIVSPSF